MPSTPPCGLPALAICSWSNCRRTARELGVRRLFCLTFEVNFFAAHGFSELEGEPVAPGVFEELLRSYDEGIAEFLDLEWVKPNTLGNTRMIKYL